MDLKIARTHCVHNLHSLRSVPARLYLMLKNYLSVPKNTAESLKDTYSQSSSASQQRIIHTISQVPKRCTLCTLYTDLTPFCISANKIQRNQKTLSFHNDDTSNLLTGKPRIGDLVCPPTQYTNDYLNQNCWVTDWTQVWVIGLGMWGQKHWNTPNPYVIYKVMRFNS